MIDLQSISTLIIAAIGGVVPFTQWLKNRLNFDGWKALLVSAAASAIGAILTLWAAGDLLPGAAMWSNIVEVTITVFMVAQGFYFAVANGYK